MEKVFKCDLCSKQFSSRFQLFNHTAYECKKKSSKRKQQVKCDECGQEFRYNYYLIIHTRLHTGERPFMCKVTDCGMKFTKLSNLNAHIKCKHSDERPFACKFPGCEHTTKTTSNLNHHIKFKHSDERPFACNFPGCDYAAKRTYHLVRHKQLNHSDDRPLFTCQYEGCNYRAKLKGSIRAHVKSIHSKTESSASSKCDYKVTRKGDLKLLIRRLHPSKRDDPKCCHPECAEYLICSYDLEGRNLNGSCSTSTAQDLHPSEADNQENIAPNTVHTSPSLSKDAGSNCSPDTVPSKTFACAESGYKTTREDDAMSYMRNFPSARGGFKCSHPKCNRSFKTHNQLRSHFRNRHKERIFQCDHPDCGKNFATAERLKLHKGNFHSEKRDACPNSTSSLPQSLYLDELDGLFRNEDEDEGSMESDQPGCHPRSANADAWHARVSAGQNEGNNDRTKQTGCLATVNSTEETLACSKCDYTMTQNEDVHMNRCHSTRVDDPKCSHSECAEFPICLYDLDGLQSDEKEESSMQCEQSGCEQTFATANTLNESNRNANLEQSLVGQILNGSSSASTAQDFQTSKADHQENIEPNTIHTRVSFSKDSGSSCSPDMGPRGDANLGEPAYLRSNWFRTLLSSVEPNQ